MNFKNDDLMSIREIKTLLNSKFPNEKASVISTHIKNYCFIQNSSLYILNENITYSKNKSEMKNVLLKLVTQFIEKSYLNIDDETREDLEENNEKIYKTMFTNASVEKYYPQLICNLENNDITLDYYFNEIHYSNGYIDLQTLEFKQRDQTKHFITKYITRNYKKSTQEQQNIVLSHFRKTYPNMDDLICILMTFGAALSGSSTKEQDILFLLGEGSSGKSFILEFTKLATECYFKELQSNTFSVSNSKIDKILNSYSSDPQIRISWVNEMEDKKLDDSLYKSFIDGNIQTTKLYTDGQQTFQHHSKTIISANSMPNIKVDTGTARRFKGYTHKSSFKTDPNLVNEKKHIYLLDEDLKDKLAAEGLLDAWVDILAQYCNKWLEGERVKYTENFEETKDTVMNSNDIFKDFIDGNLIITNNPEDRIGKNAMSLAVSNTFPKKHLTVLQIITSLKEKKIQYNAKYRCDNIQGCYVGVKFRNSSSEDLEQPPSLQSVDTSYYEELILEKDERMRQLEEEIEKLKGLLATTKVKKNKKKRQLVLVKDDEVEEDEFQGLKGEDLDSILANL